uniref:ADAM metallopeptidase domain 15 n=1 Tax=Marmota marmota marmota TaxID=9994 RepID=A0A8C5ZT97_MARMA
MQRALMCWELVGLGKDPLSPLLGNLAGFMEEQQARPERAPSGPSQPQILQDKVPIGLAEVPHSTALGLRLSLYHPVSHLGHCHDFSSLHRDLVPGRPTLAWYQPDGTQVVSEGHTLENCCYQGRVQGHTSSWVSMCACSGLRGLVVLSPERSYVLELGPGDIQGPPIISRIQDLRLPGHVCALSRNAPVPTQAPPGHPLGQRHIHRHKRDVVTETKIVELVIVADHSEVRRYPDFQRLLNRTLDVALLLDMFFQPLNVRVVLVGLEAWTQHDLIEMSPNPAVTLENFLHWRRTDLLPRLPHDSAQLVTGRGRPGGSSAPTFLARPSFLPGLNFSNCSRQALEKALLQGMGSCLFERLPSLPPMAPFCGNMFVDPGEQCDCGFPDDCTDPCCDYFTCQLRSGAQCASDGLCCQNCQLRPASWQCRPSRGDCDLPEFCPGDSSQCPPDISLGDGEPCAGGEAVCVHGRCASYAQQCQSLWGPGAQPAAPLCLQTANTRGNVYGSCGRSANGSYIPCTPRDAVCGQLQCQGGRTQPLLGLAQELRWETLEANGTQLNCSWVHLDLGNDVAQPLLTLPGTACGPGLVCLDHRCQPVDLLGAQECRSRCHGHGVCDSNRHCHCEEGWAPPDCTTQLRATSSLTTGLLLSLLLLLVLVLLGASYWHRARLRQRLCQLKGSSCQYRAAQSSPPERPGPPQRAQVLPGTKVSALGFPAPPSRPLPPDPVPKRLQAELADRPNPPTRPLPADPVVRRPKSQGPTKPPPPRKPLPADPQGRRPSGDLPGPGAGIMPSVVPSR